MMEPEKFPQANATLKAHNVIDGQECGELPVYTNGTVCVSLWKMTWEDRVRAFLFGNLWLYVWTGSTQPPVGMIIDKTIFIQNPEAEE